jgi:hypothetical protein
MRVSTGRNSSFKPEYHSPAIYTYHLLLPHLRQYTQDKMLRLPRYLPRNLRYASTAAATSTSSSAKFAPLAMKAAEEVSTKWKGTTANGGKTKNYIGGEFVDSSAKKWLEVRDPVCLLH